MPNDTELSIWVDSTTKWWPTAKRGLTTKPWSTVKQCSERKGQEGSSRPGRYTLPHFNIRRCIHLKTHTSTFLGPFSFTATCLHASSILFLSAPLGLFIAHLLLCALPKNGQILEGLLLHAVMMQFQVTRLMLALAILYISLAFYFYTDPSNPRYLGIGSIIPVAFMVNVPFLYGLMGALEAISSSLSKRAPNNNENVTPRASSHRMTQSLQGVVQSLQRSDSRNERKSPQRFWQDADQVTWQKLSKPIFASASTSWSLWIYSDRFWRTFTASFLFLFESSSLCSMFSLRWAWWNRSKPLPYPLLAQLNILTRSFEGALVLLLCRKHNWW